MRSTARYFADENGMGLAKLLIRDHAREDVVYPGQDHTSRELVEIFNQHEERLQRLKIKLGGGPWALTMSSSGIRELRLRRPLGNK